MKDPPASACRYKNETIHSYKAQGGAASLPAFVYLRTYGSRLWQVFVCLKQQTAM
jgi:hypothetical protein